jgi:hypothetical protein
MTVELSNPEFFDGRGSIIIIELGDDAAAMRMARAIARETGRSVRVKNDKTNLIRTIPAATEK